eukprot:GSChrysophyteH1.ASY1.ANO1.75.1 assembled CDS
MQTEGRSLLAAVEAGGTTWVCALAWGDDLGNPFNRFEVETATNPSDTIGKVKGWLREQVKDREIAAVGVASFGPIDPRRSSPTYGFITSTPKPGWKNTDIIGGLGLKEGGEFAEIPHLFDTDVNAPAFAEFIHDKLGGGLVVNGKTVSGLLHPEAGHIPVRRIDGDAYSGCCPFHASCLEGMVCSKALGERADCSPAELANLPDSHPVWNIAASYLAQLAASFVLIASCERVVFGGGVFNRECLYDLIRSHLKAILNGYIELDAVTSDDGLKHFVTKSVWGSQAGLVGALYLAAEAMGK